ncbi:MAG: hypothetical protein ACRDXX_02085 [Stackebrandtia sp.]
MTDKLAGRYERLLRLYPKEYREARGSEMLSTYLDSAPHGRARPTFADAADVMRGAGRRWLLNTQAGDLPAGLRLAGVLSLAAAAGLAAFWLFKVEFAPIPSRYIIQDRMGPVQSPGGVAWSLWILAALGAAILPRRAFLATIAVATAATVAAIPVSQAAAFQPPAVYIVVPQVALGMAAIAFPARSTLLARLLPISTAAVVAAAVAASPSWRQPAAYLYSEALERPWAVVQSVALALTVLVVGFAIADAAFRRSARGLWAGGILLCPVLLLAFPQLEPAATTGSNPFGGYLIDVAMLAGVTAAASIGVLLTAVVLRDRTK